MIVKCYRNIYTKSAMDTKLLNPNSKTELHAEGDAYFGYTEIPEEFDETQDLWLPDLEKANVRDVIAASDVAKKFREDEKHVS